MAKRILIAGGTGLVGSAFSTFAVNAGHEIHVLTRSKKKNKEGLHFHMWDPYKQEIASDIPDIDVIINLTGAGIADKRWTKQRKQLILDSRTETTDFLISSFPQIDTYIGASAIGYYGKSSTRDIAEDADSDSSDFMSDVCLQWEKAHFKVQKQAKKVVIFRIGIILSNDGGAFPKLVQPLKFGVAPYLGDGSMIYSWIHIDDVVSMMDYAITSDLEGIYNMVSPQPATQKDIIDAALEHKSFGIKIPTPQFVLKAMLGEMSDAVLTSTHVSASKIKAAGYPFRFPQLDRAISDLMS